MDDACEHLESHPLKQKLRPPPLLGSTVSAAQVAAACTSAASPVVQPCPALPPRFLSQLKREKAFHGSKSVVTPLTPGGSICFSELPYTPVSSQPSARNEPPGRPQKIAHQSRFADCASSSSNPGTPFAPQLLDSAYDLLMRHSPPGFPAPAVGLNSLPRPAVSPPGFLGRGALFLADGSVPRNEWSDMATD